MKAIIDGKLYDTDKAELITLFKRYVKPRSLLIEEFQEWVMCELYKTPKGAWFEIVGTDTRNPTLNVIPLEQAKIIIKIADIDKFLELFPDEVEEA
jgi:hypothetical protein